METLSGPNLTRLYEVNDQRVMQLLPVMIYMSILSILGTFGNSLVFYIYYKRFKRTASSYYILCLASLDLTACVLGMPFEVVDMRRSYTFDNPPACKIFRFVIYATVLGSALTLVVIAVDRYLKVCRPLKRYSVRMKYGLIGTLILSAILATPALVVFGKSNIATIEEYLIGAECSVDDGVHGTAWPIVYFIILVGVFLVCVTCLVIFYGRVLYDLVKRKRQMQKTVGPNSTNRNGSIAISLATGKVTEEAEKRSFLSLSGKKKSDDNIPKIQANSDSRMHVPQSQWKVPTERTTAIFICISTGFVLSFLPCLTIITARELVPNFENYSSNAMDLCVNFFIRSYYLNNVMNPLIYGFFNPSFRREVWKALRYICRCLCCRGNDSTAGKHSTSQSANDTSVTSLNMSRV